MKTTAFKNTELGPIPEDWEVKSLFEIAPLQRGFDLPSSEVEVGPYPVVYSNGILTHHAKWLCSAPGLITGRSGTIGKFTFVEDGHYWPHNTALWVTSFCGNNPKFVYYLYSNVGFARFASGTGVPTLNRNDVHAFQVPLPPLPEQRRIAEALSDADGLVAALDKLIEKKNRIKDGAMQRLLTGETRLPGFTGKWVEKRLGDFSTVARGGSPRPIESYLTTDSNGVNWVKIGDVGVDAKYIEKTSERITRKGAAYSRQIFQGDLLLSNSMSFGRPYITKIEGFIHDGWLVIQSFSRHFDKEFLYYALGSSSVVMQYRAFAAGSSVQNLNKNIVENIDIVVPPTLAEQRAIAAVLSDMDAEIAALSRERAEADRIKQGMMQELLTGKTRLTEGE